MASSHQNSNFFQFSMCQNDQVLFVLDAFDSGAGTCSSMRHGFGDEFLCEVVRKQNTSCEPWCTWYRPWSDYYDMSVTLSLPHCFDEAIALENVDAFNEITTCAGNQANEMFDTCGTLRNAVYLNRTTMVSEMLAKDAKADGGVQGPSTKWICWNGLSV